MTVVPTTIDATNMTASIAIGPLVADGMAVEVIMIDITTITGALTDNDAMNMTACIVIIRPAMVSKGGVIVMVKWIVAAPFVIKARFQIFVE